MAIDGSTCSSNSGHDPEIARSSGPNNNSSSEEKGADMMVTEEETGTVATTTSTESIEVTLESSMTAEGAHDNNTQLKPAPPPKRGGPCPCGSGLKYKKCCQSKEKHAVRLGVAGPVEGNSTEMNGDFRVLKI